MQTTEVKYTRRFNLGEYEHAEYSITATTEDKEKAQKVLAQLKADVLEAHTSEDEPTEDSPTPAPSKKAAKKAAAKAAAQVEDEESEDEDDEESEDETDNARDDEDEVETKSAKKLKTKAQPYVRIDSTHKELFSGLLKSVAPDWKKSDKSKAKGKEISKKMDGKDFLDADGEVLKEFKAEVKKLWAKK